MIDQMMGSWRYLTGGCHFCNLRHVCGDSFHALRSPGVSGVEMKICKGWLQALLSSAPHSRVLARLASLAQIGELARRLNVNLLYRQCTYHISSSNDKLSSSSACQNIVYFMQKRKVYEHRSISVKFFLIHISMSCKKVELSTRLVHMHTRTLTWAL